MSGARSAAGCILGELLTGKPIFPGSSTMNQLDRILEVTGAALQPPSRPTACSPVALNLTHGPASSAAVQVAWPVACGLAGTLLLLLLAKLLITLRRRSASAMPSHHASCCKDVETSVLASAGRPTQEDVQAICSPFAETMLEGLSCCERRELHRLFPTASPAAADLLAKLLHFNPAKRITAAEALAHPYVAQFHSPSEEPSAPGIITISIDDNVKVRIESNSNVTGMS